MIDRRTYLEMCQKVAVLREGGNAIPNDLLLKYNDAVYFPIAYKLWFDENGFPKHTALLHELYSNSSTHALLDDVILL